MSQPSPPPEDELEVDLRDPGVQDWFEKHRAVLQEDAYGNRIQYFVLMGAFIVGLIAYVAGYLLRSSAPTEPIGLLADLIYTLGFALWTAAVVVVLIEIVPEVKRRQIKRALEAYEASRRDAARPQDAR